jgi:hypothetical protein
MPSRTFRLMRTFLFLFLCLLGVGARPIRRQDPNRNDGIHLAVRPICGPLSGNVTDVNAGVNLHGIKTIVSFGVSVQSQKFYCH